MRRRVVDTRNVSEHLVDSVRNTMGEIQNLVLLALCWACTLSSSTLLTSIGPLTAEQVGAPESLAPLAVACFLFGAAITYMSTRARTPDQRVFLTNSRTAPHALGPCLAQVGALSLDLPPVRPARWLPTRVALIVARIWTRESSLLAPPFKAGDNRTIPPYVTNKNRSTYIENSTHARKYQQRYFTQRRRRA